MAVKIERANHKTPHFAKLAAGMRDPDRQEALAMLGTSPAAALYLSMYTSKEMYVTTDEEEQPLCAFGVCRMGDINLIWFVGTEEIERHKRELLTLSRLHLDELLNKYGRLENLVDARNKKSIRWLKWLGFTFASQPTPAGTEGLPFYHFYKEGGEAVVYSTFADS